MLYSLKEKFGVKNKKPSLKDKIDKIDKIGLEPKTAKAETPKPLKVEAKTKRKKK